MGFGSVTTCSARPGVSGSVAYGRPAKLRRGGIGHDTSALATATRNRRRRRGGRSSGRGYRDGSDWREREGGRTNWPRFDACPIPPTATGTAASNRVRRCNTHFVTGPKFPGYVFLTHVGVNCRRPTPAGRLSRVPHTCGVNRHRTKLREMGNCVPHACGGEPQGYCKVHVAGLVRSSRASSG